MRKLLSIFILTFLFIDSSGQGKYFEPNGIIDKTEASSVNDTGWIKLNDKERINGYTRIGDSIFGGEIACNVKPISGVDIESFEVWPGTKYARDINNVYYPLEIPCIDFADCGVCYYGKVIVENAIPKTFTYLGKEYATDGLNVYFRGESIPNADVQTFKVMDGPEYFYFATDKMNVYKHNAVFKNADPQTFYYDKNDSRTVDIEFAPKYVIGDENNEWIYTPPNSMKKIKKE